jgi:putative ABC transport system substrate-binding protein
MERRAFILGLCGVAGFAPWATLAQPAKVPTVGILALGNPPPRQFFDGLRDALRELGYLGERSIKVETRDAEGQADRLSRMAEELVQLNVDVIVGYQTPSVIAARRATSEIPIVMAGVGDPVGSGLVRSLARPGANVTGTTAGVIETAGKIIELVRELVPAAQRVAVLANETDPFTPHYLAENERMARSMGLAVEPVIARPDTALHTAFENMVAKRVDAVIVQGSLVRKDAADLAAKHQLPSFASPALFPRVGGLISYSAGTYFRETATYVDRILKGDKPANLPVGFPTKFELIVNLRTAKTLGLTIPPTLLARADQVIE